MSSQPTRHRARASRTLVALAALLAGALIVPALTVHAGDPTTVFAASGIIVPDKPDDIRILKADISIRLPEPKSYYITMRTEYVMRNEGHEAATVRLSLPVNAEISGARPRSPQPPPAVKLDGASIPYSHLTISELAVPYVKQLQDKGWELLAKSDPELKTQVESLRGTRDRARLDGLAEVEAYLRAHSDRYGDPPYKWPYNVTRFLLDAHQLAYRWELQPFEITAAMEFLDPEYKREDYPSLDDLVQEQWAMDIPFMLDPYDRRLYQPLGLMFGGRVEVLQFDVTLLPKREHTVAVFCRQQLGFDQPYRQGDKPSRQFSYVMRTARQWGAWDETQLTVRWPSSTERIQIQGMFWNDKHRSQEGGFHVASRPIGRPQRDLYIGWIP